jgi:AcrR family transcriptional regulator
MPDTACTDIIDPRIRRTRELLQQALARLLESREFEKLSVQEITDAAGVNRATFYAHYPDKFALLECMVGSRFHALLAERGVIFDGTCSAALRGIVLGVCDYLAQTLCLSPDCLSPDCLSPDCLPPDSASDRQPAAIGLPQNQMAPHMESAVVAVVRTMLLDGLRQHPAASGDSPEILAATASWAIYGAAKEWTQTPNRPSSEEMAAVVVRLVAPILNPAAA